jgi:ABC-2 type transport system permease protein
MGRTAVFAELFRKTFRDQRGALLGWSGGLTFISLFLLYFYPFISRASEVLKVLDSLPPVIKNLVGKNNFMATPEGFLNLQPFSILAPLLFIVFAIGRGADATAGEEERGTLDLLLSYPLPRWQLLLAKFAAQAAALLLLSLVFWSSLAAGTRLFRVAVDWSRLAQVIFSLLLMGLTFLSLSLLIGCLSGKRKLSQGVSGGFALVTYLINAYAPMIDGLRPYQVVSPFYYYNGRAVLINGFVPSHALVLAGLSAVFLAAALFFFARRDLST